MMDELFYQPEKTWFSEAELEPEYYLLKSLGNPPRDFDYSHLPPIVQASLFVYGETSQEEYIVKYAEGTLIEPEQGWAVTNDHRLIYESIIHSKMDGIPKPSKIPSNPSTISLDKACPLRYGWDNYFHFMNDLLGQLALLDSFGLLREMPLIIPSRLLNQHYFAAALNRSPFLSSLQWVPQDECTYFNVKKAYFVKPFPIVKRYLEMILNWLDVPICSEKYHERVFVVRTRPAGRCVGNTNVLVEIAEGLGFKVIDTARMTFDAQIELFSRTALLVGLHGAGMTNMVFRRGAPLKVLEIFPVTNIPYHFFYLCNLYGYSYDALVGGNESYGLYLVEPEVFEAKLLNLIGHDSAQ